MIEDLEDSAREELKRADHLLYVTLKYTRTADVIKNTIKRLISALDFSIQEALVILQSKKKIEEVPKTALLRAELLDKKRKEFRDAMDFYFMLRKIDASDYTGKEEFRKGVAMISEISPKEKLIVDIATLKKYFERTIQIVQDIEEKIHDKKK